LAEKRDKKGEKSLPGPPRIALSVPNSFIKGLVTKGLYQSYDKYYRKPLPNGLERCIEVSDALCGCGCAIPAAASEHYCGCCEHRMMAFCCQTLEEDEGHGSKGLCFHCRKKHSHEADGMLYNMILQPRHISLHYLYVHSLTINYCYLYLYTSHRFSR
jgi:hypothetical protein